MRREDYIRKSQFAVAVLSYSAQLQLRYLVISTRNSLSLPVPIFREYVGKERSVSRKLEAGSWKTEESVQCSENSGRYSVRHPELVSGSFSDLNSYCHLEACLPNRQGRIACPDLSGTERSASSATARLYRVGVNRNGYSRPHDTIVRQQGSYTMGSEEIAEGCVNYAWGSTETTGGRVNVIDGSGKITEGQVNLTKGSRKTARGRVNLTKGNRKTAQGWGNLIDGARQMRVSEKLTKAVISTTLESLSRFVGKRSVTVEQINYLPPHRCKRGTPLLNTPLSFSHRPYADISPREVKESGIVYYMEGKLEFGAQLKAHSPKPTAQSSRLTVQKYNNSPSRRVRSNHKTSHLSSMKIEGTRETIPYHSTIWKMDFLSSPLGGSPLGEGGPIYKRGEEGYKTFTNNLKTKDAYET